MKIDNIVSQNLDEKSARPALFVLGMHRSGTSAITGALRHSGVWVGEETELTDANVENPLGFWERRDIRDLCDQMLHSAGADWWKIANFEPDAIPRVILAEQRRKFEKIVSELDKYQAWVLKEPRLCLLLPILRHYVNNPVCIHIYRNPLEVARSLQTRNGFSISAGLALWEVYNLHALKASEGLPRISLSYESIMQHPVETLNALVKELDGLGGEHPIKPDSGLIERFINLDLYHQRATDEETEDYLLPSQHALWLRLRSGEVFDDDLNIPVSEATRQALLDLESVEVSFNLHNDRTNELEASLRKFGTTLETRNERVEALEASVDLLRSNLEERAATLETRDEHIKALEASRARLSSNLNEMETRLSERSAMLKTREATIEDLEVLEKRLRGNLEERIATLSVREERIKALKDSGARLRGNLEERTATLSVREERIKALKDSGARLRDNLEERTATLSVREERIKALEDSGARLRGNLEERTATLSVREERIKALKDSGARLRGNLEERTATLSVREGRIKALEDSGARLRGNLEERTATLSVLEERIKALEDSGARLRGNLEERTATLSVLEERIKALEDLGSRLRSKLEMRTAMLKARDKRIEALEGSAERLESNLKERTAMLKARDKRIEALEGSAERLESNLKERTATLKARDKRIEALEGSAERLESNLKERTATLKARDKRIEALEGSAERLESNLKERTATLKARDKMIDDLHNSTSWKITAPLRALSRCIRWLLRNLRRAIKLLFWLSAGQFSRAMEAVRNIRAKSGRKTAARPEAGQLEVTDRLAKLIREHGKEQRPAVRRQSAAGESRTRITVITWDLGHNPLGRAYLLADVLRRDYDVELVGAQFPRFGNEVWEPLRNCSRVALKSFPGGNFPEHYTRMEDIARQIEGDVIYVSKPRLPGLELAILAKLHRNRPVIVDVDDYEPGFFKNRGPLSLKQVKRKRHRPDFFCPHDETWTRYGESLIPMFEQVTVSNEELRKKFGGMVLPHIRDEHDFDPTVYPRDVIRAELGCTREDKVIVFAGTPRMHKGFTRIATALESLKRSDYKLLIVGSPVDNEARRFFAGIKSACVKVVPNVPFSDLSGYLCAGDLICLLQDKEQVTARFQMPGKFTDGLSMGIPVLATDVPPLINLAQKGLVELLGDTPLERKIDEIFSDYDTYKHKAVQNRETFLREYSYGANLPRLKDTIDRILNNPAPIPDAFRELVAYHRRIFSGGAGLSRVTAQVVAGGQPAPVAGPAPPSVQAGVDPVRKVESYVDDKIDIVFFWKQNDTGIYGRRQDMLVKYLAEDPRINSILHFDAPVNIFKSGHDVLKSGQGGRLSHAGLVLHKTLRRRLRLQDRGKVRSDTFIFAGKRRAAGFRNWMLPAEEDYLDYLGRVMKQQQIGQRRTVFWVCPNNFDFPSIADRFKPDMVVSDVIDDQRKWPCQPRYREMLHRNYEEILARTHLTFANCRSVFDDMQEYTDNIHLLPNAAEFLEDEAQSWKKPAELRRIKGPVIGYAGNLDITRIDIDLLTSVASKRPDWTLVFIGSMHKSREIRKLDKFSNVRFLGVRVYDDAIHYIRHFDVAMIPHLDSELTRSMNPLKLYVYFSLHVPVVSTHIANIGDFREFVQVGRTPEEFIERIDHCLNNNPVAGNVERIRNLLEANSWNERVTRILTLVGKEFVRRESTHTRPAAINYHKDGYTDCCTVCGHIGYLRREERSIRETYRCGGCGASLRYREQARLILDHFSREGSGHLADLANEAEFQNLNIYEPGLIGPFRKLFNKLPGYCNSYFWEDVPTGEFREDVQCQDLMNLTYGDNSFDLVLSSDIFEHVRKPFAGFQEVNRVLKPGGFHIFSIPSQRPMPPKTVFRVDTSGPEDVFVLPRHYHSAPKGGKSLVYTDFGEDMVEIMAGDGIDLKVESPSPGTTPATITEQMLSFYWKKL